MKDGCHLWVVPSAVRQDVSGRFPKRGVGGRGSDNFSLPLVDVDQCQGPAAGDVLGSFVKANRGPQGTGVYRSPGGDDNAVVSLARVEADNAACCERFIQSGLSREEALRANVYAAFADLVTSRRV